MTLHLPRRSRRLAALAAAAVAIGTAAAVVPAVAATPDGGSVSDTNTTST